jgi:hypothetical protein
MLISALQQAFREAGVAHFASVVHIVSCVEHFVFVSSLIISANPLFFPANGPIAAEYFGPKVAEMDFCRWQGRCGQDHDQVSLDTE